MISSQGDDPEACFFLNLKIISCSLQKKLFRQFEKGSKAHTAFHVYLKSGDSIAVIEKKLKRIKNSL